MDAVLDGACEILADKNASPTNRLDRKRTFAKTDMDDLGTSGPIYSFFFHGVCISETKMDTYLPQSRW